MKNVPHRPWGCHSHPDGHDGGGPASWPAWTDAWIYTVAPPVPSPEQIPLRFCIPRQLERMFHGARDSFDLDAEAAMRAACEYVLGEPLFSDNEVILAAARQVLHDLDAALHVGPPRLVGRDGA
jgi:hypothetical protein